MTRNQRLITAAAVALVVLATTWPFRSERLISWDAANFAFALDKIDIGAHRPHPPGYLGYVFVGRGLNLIFHDANAALTAWNVLVRFGSGFLVALLAFSSVTATSLVPPFQTVSSARERESVRAAIATAAILCTSPLLWFYASNAEIYPSEMAFALATVFAASASLNGKRSAIYWMSAILAVTALFKISAVVLLMPAALYAWWRCPPTARTRSVLIFAVIFAAIAAMFFVIQPNVLQLLWDQFSGATAPSRLGGTTTNLGRTLNRNFRDTSVNLLAALGIVNGGAVLVWMLISRRLPPLIDRWLIALWAGPWLILLLFVHIGNPGYVLPLVPVLCLILGAWYARLRGPVFLSVVALQAVVNLAQVAWFVPAATVADGPRYREKTVLQRMASDFEPLAFPTLATVRRSDEAIDQLLAISSTCDKGPWVIAAGGDPVDWRRVSYYLPNAAAIRLTPDQNPQDLAQDGDIVRIAGERPLTSACGLIWLSSAPQASRVSGMPQGGRYVHGLGWVFPAGAGAVSPARLSWTEPR